MTEQLNPNPTNSFEQRRSWFDGPEFETKQSPEVAQAFNRTFDQLKRQHRADVMRFYARNSLDYDSDSERLRKAVQVDTRVFEICVGDNLGCDLNAEMAFHPPRLAVHRFIELRERRLEDGTEGVVSWALQLRGDAIVRWRYDCYVSLSQYLEGQPAESEETTRRTYDDLAKLEKNNPVVGLDEVDNLRRLLARSEIISDLRWLPPAGKLSKLFGKTTENARPAFHYTRTGQFMLADTQAARQ